MPPQAWKMVEVMLLQLWVFCDSEGDPWCPVSLPCPWGVFSVRGQDGTILCSTAQSEQQPKPGLGLMDPSGLSFPPHSRALTPLNSIPFSFSLSQLNARL